ncbi:GumC family protein [Larkinella terrae]|uniref:Polysaccharide biosynthesis tyrosine autokinase n=1 Tax=Larkinella terrae TaxID=2025311 RepID=A0A7K0EGC9_9BACT|nr:tyrosine-protein kinase family protein [Larkinella terrae]MRS60874.1 polysaccharide biosynthesis tyrosine autokinase [Larkinella terrae]
MKSSHMYSYPTYPQGEISSSDVRGTLKDYLKHWKWFLTSLITMIVAGFVYIWFTEPIYRIQASLLVKDEQKGLGNDGVLKELNIYSPSKVVENEIEILKSNSLMKKVVDSLGLNVRYFRSTPFGKREIYSDAPVRVVLNAPTANLYRADLQIGIISPTTVRLNDWVYPANQVINTPFGRLQIFVKQPVVYTNDPLVVQVMTDPETIRYYLSKLKVEPSSKSSTVLVLSIEDAVPVKGEAILNQMIANYNSAATNEKNRMVAGTLSFIQSRLKLVSGELALLEKSIENYKATSGITDIGAGAQALLNGLQSNDAQLNQVAIQLSALGDVERYIRSNSENRVVLPSSLKFSDPTLSSLIGKLTDLESQRNVLARNSPESNPVLRSLNDQISATKSSINETVGTLRSILTNTRSQLLATNRRYESRIRVIPGKERMLMNITRQQAIKNNLYNYLLQKQEETALSYASIVSTSQVIDAASGSPEPIKPLKILILLLFGSVGLLVPAAIITVKRAFNERVSSRAEINQTTDVPVIGEIAYVRHEFPVIVNGRKRSIAAEQIRALRTNLQFLRESANESQVLLFTSSLSGEGKSFLSLNVAVSQALVGRPTLIIDMDLRRPKLHKALSMLNFRGCSSYLTGEASLDEVLQQVPGFDNLFIISCGPIPLNPSELLSGPRLQQLIEEARTRFDNIIIDSPPIGLVTDAQLIGPFADVTLYAVRHNITHRSYLGLADSLYKEKRFPKLNIVLNSVKNKYSYDYRYYYYRKSGNDKPNLLRKYLLH